MWAFSLGHLPLEDMVLTFPPPKIRLYESKLVKLGYIHKLESAFSNFLLGYESLIKAIINGDILLDTHLHFFWNHRPQEQRRGGLINIYHARHFLKGAWQKLTMRNFIDIRNFLSVINWLNGVHFFNFNFVFNFNLKYV